MRKRSILYSLSKCVVPVEILIDGQIEKVDIDCSIVKPIEELVKMGHLTRSSCSGLDSEHPKNYGKYFHVALELPKISPELYKQCISKSARTVGLKTEPMIGKDNKNQLIRGIEIHGEDKENKLLPAQQRNIFRLNQFVEEVKKNQCMNFFYRKRLFSLPKNPTLRGLYD